MQQTLTWIAALLIAILLVGLVSWFVINYQPAEAPTPATDETEVVEIPVEVQVEELYEDETSSFGKAFTADSRGDLHQAQEHYQLALVNEEDPAAQAHIYYKLARTNEKLDPPESIRQMKELIANPEYPDSQKKFAAVMIPEIISRTYDEDPSVLEIALEGEPYQEFRSFNLRRTLHNFYRYAHEFGWTGIGEFVSAKALAEDIRDGYVFEEAEILRARGAIDNFMLAGDEFIRDARNSPRNAPLIPAILRQKARANAVIAQLGDQAAIDAFHDIYEDAILQGSLTKIGGAVRWDYFRYAYDTFGEESFDYTSKHINYLLTNIDDYKGMQTYFELEKDNYYENKERVVVYANSYPIFKKYLIDRAGWSESDFSVPE